MAAREIVAARADGADCPHQLERARRQCAAARAGAGAAAACKPGDRVATLAMNHDRHLVTWFGVVGMGGVIHTLNPRLFDDQLDYIVNHAEDRVCSTTAVRAAGRAHEAASGRRSSISSASTTNSTSCSPPRTATIAGTRATSASPAASATPAARPGTRRACSTSIARPCFTPCRSSRPTSSTSRRAR